MNATIAQADRDVDRFQHTKVQGIVFIYEFRHAPNRTRMVAQQSHRALNLSFVQHRKAKAECGFGTRRVEEDVSPARG
jgi:hypothetical protein